MKLRTPADIDDLAHLPELKEAFFELWDRQDEDGRYLGRYVHKATRQSTNYVDPRLEAPTTSPIPVPWNGFPRLLSRFLDDETTADRKQEAEAAADVPTPLVYWVAPGRNGKPALFETEQHRLAFFGDTAVRLARPLRRRLANGVLGPNVPRFRRQQDEYLEWHATHDADGRLLALAFTAEPPDYWMALAEVAPEVVLDRYRSLVGPQVTMDDLFHPTDLAAFGIDDDGEEMWFRLPWKGLYDELNRFTTTDGIVHLTHRANTLGAEVALAADASVVLDTDFAPPPPPQSGAPDPEIRRIACGGYGGINRSSDPLIGLGVGDAVAAGARVTLTEPIGLYVGTAGISGLTGPQGQPVGDAALQILRGKDDGFEPRILRFEVRLPTGLEFRLDECLLEGRPLRRGGQVARKTTMVLYAQPYPESGDTTPQTCGGKACRHPDRHELFAIQDPASDCPGGESLSWLLQAPLLPAIPVAASQDFQLAFNALTAVEDTPLEVEGTLDVAIELSGSRTPGHS